MKSRLGAGRAVERLHVGRQLDQVAGHEARREPEVAQELHQQPAGVAARAAAQLERLLDVCTPGSSRMT